MKKLLLFLFAVSGLAYGQYTAVSASAVHDPNQVVFANGKVSATLTQGAVFIGTGTQPPNTASAQMSATGGFSLTLASNTALSPDGTQWTFNVCNSNGLTCFTTAITITGTSQDISATLNAAAVAIAVPTDFVRYFKTQAAPANPPSGFDVLYADSGTGNLTCLTSSGAACISGGGGGGGATFQVNGVNTSNQTTINFLNSVATNGLTVGFTNPSLGGVQLTLAGTLANTGLANSSVTVSTTSPLGGGGALSLGGSLTLTCAACATSANNLSFFAATTSAQLAGVLTNETGTGVVVFSDSPVFTTQITSPIFVSAAADPADAGAIRLGNNEIIGWENATPGTDLTLKVDASNILQSSANFNAPVLTQNTNAVADSTKTLNFFSSTTSAQLASVISNETGTGVVVFNSSPTITTPAIGNFTVSTLPAAGTLGRVAVVTDGTTKTDCTSGGGSTVVWCIDSGSVWTSASISAGSGTVNNCGTAHAIANYATTGTAVSCDAALTTDGSGTLTAAAFKTASTSNGGLDGTEGTGAGLTAATGHDLLWPDSTDHRWKVNNNNGTSSDMAVLGDNLGVFAATTSAQLAAVISNETGTGVLVFGTAPTFTTSITTPVMISGAADPADAGAIRLGNAEVIGWENATPGTDLTVTMNASNVFTVSTPVSATTGFEIGGTATSNHCLLGNGTNYVDSAACGLTSSGLNQFASTTSAQLAGVVSDETGSGALVFATSPTFTTPSLGAATASGLTLSSITGSTQCLHVNTSGVVSGTGSDCGAGSGGVSSVGLTINATSPSGIFTVTGSPVTTSGTLNFNLAGTSGGIPYFSSSTVMSSSAALTVNVLTKGGGAGAAPTNSLVTDDGTAATYTGTGGYKAPVFTSTGTTAGFADYPQGTTSSAVAPCNTATSICEQAPTSVTSYLVNKPGVAAGGTLIGTNTSSVITQGFSGDSNHSATVTIGSGTSVGSTSLCSTTFCPVGTYRVNVYVDITTACGTTGTYVVNLIYTDDQGSKTVPVNLEGTGSVPATGVLTTTSTANFGYDSFILRSTGGASINYSTTAVACGTAGPMVGKLYMSVEPVM